MRPKQTKLAITLDDGSLAVMSFVTRGFNPDGSVQFEREPTDEHVRAECAKAQLRQVSWRILGDGELPAERDYRAAWVDRDGRVEHDMPKAREIHRAKLRVARQPLLAALDIEYQRADEREDSATKRDVAARKQALRDAPADPRIEQCETVGQLRLINLPD